ncbi:DUF523 domain-containing protein [bacterium]|nr:DUF523 domain-containing protein [bacterium]
MPRVGISACLLGQEVRWDGRHKLDAPLAERLAREVELVPVCPEVELGLGVPREPIRLERRSGETRLVAVESGRDLTASMLSFARSRVRDLSALGLSGYVLKARSPSCGKEAVPVLEDGREEKTGRGFFARALLELLPDLPVEESESLGEPAALLVFLERVRSHEARRRG